jgi:hypothetical protein
MRFLGFLLFFLFPAFCNASILCRNTGTDYVFSIVRSGQQYLISGNHSNGRYTGKCEAIARQNNGHVLLIGIAPDEFLRRQCYAEITLGLEIGSKVSVPDDKTYGDLSNERLTCSGSLD